jgi:hypothetical protein
MEDNRKYSIDDLFKLGKEVSKWEDLLDSNIEEIKKGNAVKTDMAVEQLKYIKTKIKGLTEKYYKLEEIINKN